MYLDMIIYFAVSFLGALALGPIVIPQLHKLKFGQTIREEGPQAHLAKGGTPVMGGLIFLTAWILPLVFYHTFESLQGLLIILSTLAFGAIGFADDYIKVVRKHNLGLRAKQKFAFQLVFAVAVAYVLQGIGTQWHMPFFNNTIDLGVFFIPVAVFFIVGFDNAVNLTDGIDGLATSVTAVVAFVFALFSIFQEEWLLVHVNLAMMGALLGYLKYNWHPARVFMGDVGSLGLGGYVITMALLLNIPVYLVLIGSVYVLETASVIIQVLYFKKTKKRVFKMTPIHHHFELSGWNEKKIVGYAVALTVFMSTIAVLLYIFGGSYGMVR